MRKIVIGSVVLVGLALLVLGGLLAWAHLGIRAERAELPTERNLYSSILAADRPVRLSYINTATQPMPRAGVLDADTDPHPDAAYVMSHPSFVLEWEDGRILLIDTGMTRDVAIEFGDLIEKLGAASALEPLTPVADALGEKAKQVRGVVFTHLHMDHVGALPSLCATGAKFDVFMTRAQAERPNYTTSPGLDLVRKTPCATIRVLDDEGPAHKVPGFPGVAVIAAGGHTPGTQLISARVRTNDGDHLVAFAGDIVNNVDGIVHQVSKPWAYRMFVVPEDDERLGEVRGYLRDLALGPVKYEVLVSHDQLQLEASSIKAYAAP